MHGIAYVRVESDRPKLSSARSRLASPQSKAQTKTPFHLQASDFHDPFPKMSASLKPTRLPKKIQVNAKHEIIRTSS